MANKTNNRGQVALVMVLIMTVVSAVVVSVASRTTSETRIQRLSKDSSDAFLTAQAGLEEALSRQEAVSLSDSDKSYTVTLNNTGQNGLLTDKISSGSSVDLVLNASPLLQGVKVYWKSANGLPVSLLITKYGNGQITDYAYDTLGVNGFTAAPFGGSLSSSSFPYGTPQINIDTTITKVKVTVFGDSAFLGIEPIGDVLPIQTINYKSEASVGTGLSKVKYGLEYQEAKNAKVPEVFDYALFSLGTIIQ
jgi:hypothetical protein